MKSIIHYASEGLALGFFLAFLTPKVMAHFSTPPSLPSLDANTHAYALILKGQRETKVETANVSGQ
jgi:hypothetical protein